MYVSTHTHAAESTDPVSPPTHPSIDPNPTLCVCTGGSRTLSAKLTEERGPAAAKGKGAAGGAKEARVDEYSVAVQMVGERPLADIVNYVTQVCLCL